MKQQVEVNVQHMSAPMYAVVYNSLNNKEEGDMTTIHELTDDLLLNHEPAKWLRLADSYIQMFNKSPREFILPREHARLKPLIEIYAHDLQGFVLYILGVRDSYTHDAATYADLHKLYRTVSTRALQQDRRVRLNAAVEKAMQLRGRPASFHTRATWARRMEQAWGQRRLQHMSEYRDKTQRNRLTVEERSEILDEFWKSIEEEIARGDLPPMEGE